MRHEWIRNEDGITVQVTRRGLCAGPTCARCARFECVSCNAGYHDLDDCRAQHDYLSTACAHGLHRECRITCKFCPATCRCACGHVMSGMTV